MARFCLALWVVLALAACQESKLQGLEGRWDGTVICVGGTVQVTMSLSVEGNSLSGSAQTRYKDNNKQWDVKGKGATTCQEDSCHSDRDCPLGFDDGDAQAGELRKCALNPVCAQRCQTGDAGGNCDPCANCKPCQLCLNCQESWLPVLLTYADEDVLIPDPELKLWRFGDFFLKGSIVDYCPDGQTLHAEVELRKN
jgi:hypothetical protein